jgi:hypothetical protein
VVVSPMSGYFPDPLPIHFTGGVNPSSGQWFSGSNQTLLNCAGTITPGCFATSSITVDYSLFATQATSVGSTVGSVGNNNIYQDNSGNWQMATTLHVTNPADASFGQWNVIAHAHPTNNASPVPTAWAADTILVGSLATPQKANYDGKYFQDSGNLYLLYSMAITTTPALHDGVVAQLMVSATQLSSSQPVVLIEPDTTNGGFNSEYFFGLNPSAPFKLVETGNPAMIGDKYALAYSTGDYQETDYKAGVAWSDTFIPAAGTTYQKVLKVDTAGVWGTAGNTEVQYLLQAQESGWPNYVAAQVLAPGVPSFVNDNGVWYMYFAGYSPSDAPTIANGDFDPSHRRPYFVQLNINIPAGATAAGTSGYNLAGWMTPATQ